MKTLRFTITATYDNEEIALSTFACSAQVLDRALDKALTRGDADAMRAELERAIESVVVDGLVSAAQWSAANTARILAYLTC